MVGFLFEQTLIEKKRNKMNNLNFKTKKKVMVKLYLNSRIKF